MALLKKGSKGGDVEKLQTLLNKFGAKPELKIDGQFGPLTDKALRKAQAKLKLDKVDGKAGDYTMAALNYGKPLPKMTARDLSKESAQHKLVRKHNEKMQSIYGQLQRDADVLDQLLTKNFAKIKTRLDATEGPRAQGASAAESLAKLQADYHKHLLSNPAAAARCAEAVDGAMPTYTSHYDALNSEMGKVSKDSKAFRDTMKSAIKKFESGLDALDTQVETVRDASRKLTNS